MVCVFSRPPREFCHPQKEQNPLLMTRDPVTGEKSSSPFVAWLEADADVEYLAVVLTLESGNELTASGNHYLSFSSDKGETWITTSFSSVRVGDVVRARDGSEQTVVSVDSFPVKGAYAPATLSHSLIVDDVVVSMWAHSDSVFLAVTSSWLAWSLGCSVVDAEILIRSVLILPFHVAYHVLPESVWVSLFDASHSPFVFNSVKALLSVFDSCNFFFLCVRTLC